jgi:adenine-specific DNA-methyltransferase
VYVSNEDGGRHTKWLNFMAPRLFMLRKLLNDEHGVIFVSINDVELFRLGMLMNEIFKEENWVGTLVWKGATDNNPTNIAIEHEYILCYAKNRRTLPTPWRSAEHEAKEAMLGAYERSKADSKDEAELARNFAAYTKENRDFLGDLYRYRRVDTRGPHARRRNLDNPGKPGGKYVVKHPVTKRPCRMPGWGWRFPERRMKELIKEGRIWFGADETQIPQLKVYLDEVEFPLRSVISVPSRTGSNELARLFGRRDAFKNPKPVGLMEILISYSTPKDGLVLDAFAGSGTTGQAVLQLNAADHGNRKFILIEEGRGRSRRTNFCRTLTAKRVKAAIQKDAHNAGFTYLKAGQKLDRDAIVNLERDALASLICQVDETGKGKGIARLNGYDYIIGKNHRQEAICLVWNGEKDSEVTSKALEKAAKEVTAAGLKRPFRIYGTYCRVSDTRSWRFCQIPDEILVQMHIQDDSSEAAA